MENVYVEGARSGMRRVVIGGMACGWALLLAGNANAQGLTGVYHEGKNFGTEVATRVDPGVDFTWAAEDMPEGVANTNFSVRWTGQVNPRYSGVYRFGVTADDGVRLWVDGQLMVNAWLDQGPTTYFGELNVEEGRQYDLMLEFYQGGGGARTSLFWSSDAQVEEIIPSDRLTETSQILAGNTEVQLSSVQLTTGERSTEQARLLITRFGPLDEPLTVGLEAGGNAEPGLDYGSLPETVEIPAGRTSVGINIAVIDDFEAEETEEIQVSLLPGDGYEIGDNNSLTVEVTDNDGAGQVNAWSIVGTVDHGGSSAANLVVVVNHDNGEEAGRAVRAQPDLYSIQNLEAGSYQVMAFLDEDKDGELDEDERSMMHPEVLVLPPDALNVDFDFSPDCALEPTAPGCSDSGEDTPDAGDEPDAGDGTTGEPDGGDDSSGDSSGESNKGDEGDDGCQQTPGRFGGGTLAMLCLGMALMWQRKTGKFPTRGKLG